MKRVDFDPDGERNPQNRGKSRYERISWDEASNIVAGEIMRVKETYGGSAISGITSSHHNWGIVGYKMGPFARFMNMLEFTPVLDNPDSWEGWHWGASHTYGFFWRLGMPEPYDMPERRSAERGDDRLLVQRPGHHPRHLLRPGLRRSGGSGSRRRASRWSSSTPSTTTRTRSWAASGSPRAWAPTRPSPWPSPTCGSREDTYNKDYVADRTIGFDKFKPYVMGETDGVPKTPEWAAEESGVDARVIRTLAREWAAKRTILSGGSRGGEGGACRTAYGTEWARMMVLLQAMQGLGAPGRSIWGTTMGAPNDTTIWFPGYGEPEGRMSMSTKAAKYIPQNPTKQRLWRLTVPEAILDGHTEWYGDGFCGKSLEQQFIHYKYPMEGYSEIKLWYRYGGSFIGTMSDTNNWVRMYQSPKLEFVVNQDIWWQSETRFADIILPACTNFERDDIGEWAAIDGYTVHASSGCNYRYVVREQKCIEPLWESKSDYEIFALVAEKMGLRDKFTDGGKTEVDWAKAFFDISDLPKVISWEEFNQQGLPHHQHQGRLQAHSVPALVLRRPRLRHARPGQPQAPHREARRAGHLQRQDRVRVGEPQAVLPRRRGTAGGAALHPELRGPPHHRAVREVPAAAHVAAPAHVVPLPLRQAHRLAERHPGAPHQEGRARLVAGPHQPGGRGRARHQQQRHRAALQRPRLGALHRGDHRPGPPGRHPQLRLGGPLRSAAAGRSHVDGPRRLREHPHARPHDVQERAGHDAELLSHRDREVGGLEMTRLGLLIDVTKCSGCHNCFLACRDEYFDNDYSPLLGCRSRWTASSGCR